MTTPDPTTATRGRATADHIIYPYQRPDPARITACHELTTRVVTGRKTRASITCAAGYSDLVASGAIHTILGRGLRVPEDVAIIGYDDIEDGRYSQPAISTISPDKKAIAQLAVDRLVMRIGSAAPVLSLIHI